MQHVMTGLAMLIAAACGAALGILFTVAHRAVLPIGDFRLPYAIVLGVCSVAAFLVAMRLLWETRWPAIGGALGIVGAILVFSLAGAGGSVIVGDDGYGWSWLLLPTAAAAVVVAWPRRRRAASGAGDTIDGPENPAEEP